MAGNVADMCPGGPGGGVKDRGGVVERDTGGVLPGVHAGDTLRPATRAWWPDVRPACRSTNSREPGIARKPFCSSCIASWWCPSSQVALTSSSHPFV
mmetsp:Transcript_85998/g.119359  ORF Transcript_85998/g.119359 Transcript_85998/m.119359 type:complete len:97 (-) Transcript_85998:162-452(-)